MINIPTEKWLRDYLASLYENQIQGCDARNSWSDIRIKLVIVCAGLMGLYNQLLNVFYTIFITTADTDGLNRWGGVFKIQRKPATISSGSIKIYGTQNTIIPLSTSATFTDGTIVQTKQQTVLDQNDTGGYYAIVACDSVTTGSASNEAVNKSCTITSPPAGVTSTATVNIAFTGGADPETDDQYRARLLNRVQQPPQGGNTNDFQTWALSQLGIGYAACIPGNQRRGLGTVDVVCMGMNGDVPGQDQVPYDATGNQIDTPTSPTHGTVWSFINSIRPVGMDSQVNVNIYGGHVKKINMSVQAQPLPGYEFDDIFGNPHCTANSAVVAGVTRLYINSTTNLTAGMTIVCNGETGVIQTVTAGQYIDLTGLITPAPTNSLVFVCIRIVAGSSTSKIYVQDSLAGISDGLRVVINGQMTTVSNIDLTTSPQSISLNPVDSAGNYLSSAPGLGDIIYPGGILASKVINALLIYTLGDGTPSNKPLAPRQNFIHSVAESLIIQQGGFDQANLVIPAGNVFASDGWFETPQRDQIDVIRIGIVTILPIGNYQP